MKKPIKLNFSYSAEEHGIKCAYGYVMGFLQGADFVECQTVLQKFIAVNPDVQLIADTGRELALRGFYENQKIRNVC